MTQPDDDRPQRHDAEPPPRARQSASKRPLLWLAIACLSPFVGSFALYHWWTPTGGQVNYGTLLEPRQLPVEGLQPTPDSAAASVSPAPAAPTTATTPDAATQPFRGKWLLLVADTSQCGQPCQLKLYATRQARAMTGKERDRVVRVWVLSGDGAPDPALLAQHPDLVVARADAALAAALPADVSDAIHIVDPLGNLILRYPASPDIRGLHKDLRRLLVASRIG
jgi:hypothetical protein